MYLSGFILEEQSECFIFILELSSASWDSIQGYLWKTLIDSQYLVSLGQGVEHYEWRFASMNMTVVLSSSSYPFPISPPTMPSSTKVISTSYSSASSVVKSTETNKHESDSRDKEGSTQIMKKKKKQILELSNEENKEEKEEEKDIKNKKEDD